MAGGSRRDDNALLLVETQRTAGTSKEHHRAELGVLMAPSPHSPKTIHV